MIDPRDRGQLLRMAGNIACGLVGYTTEEMVPMLAAKIAMETLKAVDAEITREAMVEKVERESVK